MLRILVYLLSGLTVLSVVPTAQQIVAVIAPLGAMDPELPEERHEEAEPGTICGVPSGRRTRIPTHAAMTRPPGRQPLGTGLDARTSRRNTAIPAGRGHCWPNLLSAPLRT